MNRACIDYANALNLIPVVFYNSKIVKCEYKNLLEMYYRGDNISDSEFNDSNFRLISAIIKDIGYDNEINWKEISLIYAPNWYFRELEKISESSKLTMLMNNLITTLINNKNNKEQGNKDKYLLKVRFSVV